MLVAPWISSELIEAGVRRCSSSCNRGVGLAIVLGVKRRPEIEIYHVCRTPRSLRYGAFTGRVGAFNGLRKSLVGTGPRNFELVAWS